MMFGLIIASRRQRSTRAACQQTLPSRLAASKAKIGAIGSVIVLATTLVACSSNASASVMVKGQDKLGAAQHTCGPLHTDGAQIKNAQGQTVELTGVNWFGFETQTFAPQGLNVRNYQDMLDQMAHLGFNTLRLPYSNQLFDPSSVPTGINYGLNPDLRGLQGLALMDKIVDGAQKAGLCVILDQHRPDAYAQSALWYTPQVPQSVWLHDWVMLAQHYKNNPTVIGADLHNEPHDPATWGDGNPATDWRLAAEQGGNAVLAVNPNWLIIVEGIATYHGDSYWWGGNLEGAKQYPVELSVPHQLVYSAHDYGPEVYDQNWFQASDLSQEYVQRLGDPLGLPPDGEHRACLSRRVWRLDESGPGGCLANDASELSQSESYQLHLLVLESRLVRYRRHSRERLDYR